MLSEELTNRLTDQLVIDDPNDDDLAAIIAELQQLVTDVALTWRENTHTLETHKDQVAPPDAVVACSFGYRRQLNGNIDPGPMNAELAKIAARYQIAWACPVYAQWEIAESGGNPIPRQQLFAIYPDVNPEDATIDYLSTKHDFEKVQNGNVYQVDETGDLKKVDRPPTVPKRVIVVAHRDHALRCLNVGRGLGFDAFSMFNDLPPWYDPESAQPWTTSRRNYLIHDLGSRLNAYRRKHRFASPITK